MFNIGPSGGFLQKMGRSMLGPAANSMGAIDPSMGNRPNMRQGGPVRQQPRMGTNQPPVLRGVSPQPTFNTMPVNQDWRMAPISDNNVSMTGGGIQTPGQQPLEENQLWRTYNRLLGGGNPMASRLMF